MIQLWVQKFSQSTIIGFQQNPNLTWWIFKYRGSLDNGIECFSTLFLMQLNVSGQTRAKNWKTFVPTFSERELVIANGLYLYTHCSIQMFFESVCKQHRRKMMFQMFVTIRKIVLRFSKVLRIQNLLIKSGRGQERLY